MPTTTPSFSLALSALVLSMASAAQAADVSLQTAQAPLPSPTVVQPPVAAAPLSAPAPASAMVAPVQVRAPATPVNPVVVQTVPPSVTTKPVVIAADDERPTEVILVPSSPAQPAVVVAPTNASGQATPVVVSTPDPVRQPVIASPSVLVVTPATTPATAANPSAAPSSPAATSATVPTVNAVPANTSTPVSAAPVVTDAAKTAAAVDPSSQKMIPLYAPMKPHAVRQVKRGKMAGPEATPVMPSNDPSRDPAQQLDVSAIDAKLEALIKVAGHYPPNIPGRRDRYLAEQDAAALATQLDQYAVVPNASAEVLLRAVKANQVARNLDTGNDSALKAGVYMRRLIAMTPTDAEANYWYGTMLAEGGGMKEGIPYLNKAIKAGYVEGYLPLAQAYLSLEKRQEALNTLKTYRGAQNVDLTRADSLISKVEQGGSSVW